MSNYIQDSIYQCDLIDIMEVRKTPELFYNFRFENDYIFIKRKGRSFSLYSTKKFEISNFIDDYNYYGSHCYLIPCISFEDAKIKFTQCVKILINLKGLI